jgi:hypothetical protein
VHGLVPDGRGKYVISRGGGRLKEHQNPTVVVVVAAAGVEERGRAVPHNVVDEVRTGIEALARPVVKGRFRYRDADRARSGQEHLKNKLECVLDGRLPIAVLAEESGGPDRGHVRDGGTPRSAAKEGVQRHLRIAAGTKQDSFFVLGGPDGRARHPTAREVRCASPFLSPRLQQEPWQVARFSVGSSRSRGPTCPSVGWEDRRQ